MVCWKCARSALFARRTHAKFEPSLRSAKYTNTPTPIAHRYSYTCLLYCLDTWLYLLTDGWCCWCLCPEWPSEIQRVLSNTSFIWVCWTSPSRDCSGVSVEANGYHHSEDEPVLFCMCVNTALCTVYVWWFLTIIVFIGHWKFGSNIQVWTTCTWHNCHNWQKCWPISL